MKCLDEKRASDGRILSRFVEALLGCLLLLHLIGYVPSVESNCIWYGSCSRTVDKKRFNCFYNGPAKPVQDETLYILNKYCPQFASGRVCCDNDQLTELKKEIALVENLLAGCPSCMDNFMKHICGMICSPDQSDFIKPVSLEQFNSTHQRVTEIDYYLSTTYKEATFNSCQEVPVPIINGTVFDLMCGEYGAENCTADLLFEYMGDNSSPFVQFQINYVEPDQLSHGYTSYNPQTRQGSWNETIQGCKKIELTTDQNANTTEKNIITPDRNSTIPIKTHNLTEFNTTTDINIDKTGCCTINCELLYRQDQRKLQVQEDYYSFKKDYLRQKLVLLKEQTELFKTLTMEYVKMNKRN